MSTDNRLAERIEQLEMRVAYQDQTIEDLNQALTDQWKRIDELTRRLSRLDEQISEASAGAGATPLQEPPPPHY